MPDTDRSAVSEHLVPDSAKLFVFFGGLSGGLGMPPFEFYRASQVLHYSKLFIRDPMQMWYQGGLPSIGDNAVAVGEFLNDTIVKSGATEIVLVGNSMGGFAALLFCAMLQKGRAIAFAPQTFVSDEMRKRHRDMRWPVQIGKMLVRTRRAGIYELKPWIDNRFPEMQADIYVPSSVRLDTVHADELTEFKNIRIHRFADADHGLVAKLRDDGLLPGILNP